MPRYLFYRSPACDDVWVPCGMTREEAQQAAANLIRAEVDVMFDQDEKESVDIELMFKEMTEAEYDAIPDM